MHLRKRCGREGPDAATSVALTDAVHRIALLDALKAAVQREDGTAERLDSKTRQLLALVGLFFTVVQTVAFSSLKFTQDSPSARKAILLLAIAALVTLGAAALLSFRQQKTVKVDDLLLNRANALVARSDPEVDVIDALSRDYLQMIYSRREANLRRADRYQWTVLFATPSVAITAAELLVALAARLP